MQYKQCRRDCLEHNSLHPRSSPLSSPAYNLRIREPRLPACLTTPSHPSWQGASNSRVAPQSSTDTPLGRHPVLSRSTETTSCCWKSSWTFFLSSSLTRLVTCAREIYSQSYFGILPDYFWQVFKFYILNFFALNILGLKRFRHFTVFA